VMSYQTKRHVATAETPIERLAKLSIPQPKRWIDMSSAPGYVTELRAARRCNGPQGNAGPANRVLGLRFLRRRAASRLFSFVELT
jgi:hypothetical protein